MITTKEGNIYWEIPISDPDSVTDYSIGVAPAGFQPFDTSNTTMTLSNGDTVHLELNTSTGGVRAQTHPFPIHLFPQHRRRRPFVKTRIFRSRF